MSLHLPAPAWQKLQAFLDAHPTCQVLLHFHQGQVRRMDLCESVTVGQILLLDNTVAHAAHLCQRDDAMQTASREPSQQG